MLRFKTLRRRSQPQLLFQFVVLIAIQQEHRILRTDLDSLIKLLRYQCGGNNFRDLFLRKGHVQEGLVHPGPERARLPCDACIAGGIVVLFLQTVTGHQHVFAIGRAHHNPFDRLFSVAEIAVLFISAEGNDVTNLVRTQACAAVTAVLEGLNFLHPPAAGRAARRLLLAA